MVSAGLREQLAGTEDAIPEADIPEHLGDVWRCWGRLSQDRPWLAGGMGGAAPRHIEYDKVVAWCRFNDVPGCEVPFFDACIREMDNVYLEWHRSKNPPAGGR